MNTQPRLLRDLLATNIPSGGPSPDLAKRFDDNAIHVDDVPWGFNVMSKERFLSVVEEYCGKDEKYLLHLIDCTWNCAF